jgi:hypothetical protein
MKRSVKKLIAVHLLLAVFLPGNLPAATAKKIKGAFSAFAYANPPFWIAKDLHLFDMNFNFEPSLEGVKFIRDFLAEQRPELATKKPPTLSTFASFANWRRRGSSRS